MENNLIAPGDVLLYSTVPAKRTFVQRMICKITDSPYSHAELVYLDGPDKLLVASAESPHMVSATMDERIAKSKTTRFLVLRWHSLPDPADLSTQLFRIGSSAICRTLVALKIPYDWRSIWAQARNYFRALIPWVGKIFPIQEARLFCSETVQVVYKEAAGVNVQEGMKPQPFFAPVHIEQQARAGKFVVIASYPPGLWETAQKEDR